MIRDSLIEYCIYSVCRIDSLDYPDTDGVLCVYRAYLEDLEEDELIEEVERSRERLREIL